MEISNDCKQLSAGQRGAVAVRSEISTVTPSVLPPFADKIASAEPYYRVMTQGIEIGAG